MKKLLYTIVFLVVILSTTHSQNIPDYIGYVNDFANILSPQAQAELISKIKQYEKQSSIEIAIVTISDIQGVSIEEYSMALAEKWKVGKKGLDNGLILFVSIDTYDRGFRIEVGRGLEGRMTDAESRSITNHTVQNYFKKSEFDAGIAYALDKVLEVVGSETQEQYKAYQALKEKERQESMAAFWYWVKLIVISVVVLVILFFIFRYWYNAIKEKERLEKLRVEAEMDLQYKISKTTDGFDKIKLDLEKFAKVSFSNSTSVLMAVSISREEIQKIPTTKQTTEEYNKSFKYIEEKYEFFQSELKRILSEWATKVECEKAPNIIAKFSKTILDTITENKEIAKKIDASNPSSVWVNLSAGDAFAHAKMGLEEAELSCKQATKFLGLNRFIDADRYISKMDICLSGALENANYPKKLQKMIADAVVNAKKDMASMDALVEKAKKKVEQDHVKESTKKLMDKIESEKAKVEKASSVKEIDWLALAVIAAGFVTFVTGISGRADGDVSDYLAAVRRRKEEEEEEARRKKRAAAAAASAAAASIYSSHNNDSYHGGGSGGGSFGGGSFSGGGSTSRW